MDYNKCFIKIKNKFDKYARSFDRRTYGIKVKYSHTYRVVENAELLANKVFLDQKQVFVAKIIALFHDYARFLQWRDYKTFNDKKSFDHGDKAVELLFDNNEISVFNIPSEVQLFIKFAIKYHNKYDIDYNELKNKFVGDDYELAVLHCKIIKDADKLDIYYMLKVKKISIRGEYSHSGYNNLALKQLINGELIDNKNCNSILDAYFRFLSFINDLHFQYSKKMVIDNNYIVLIYNTYEPYILKNDKQVFNYAYNEFLKRIKL